MGRDTGDQNEQYQRDVFKSIVFSAEIAVFAICRRSYFNLKRLSDDGQNKSVFFFEDSVAEIFVQQNVNNTATKIMKTVFFKEMITQHF